MTADEKAAWRDVKTDKEAQRLIDLFWARRDPTPGTPRNEYREMIAARIADADKFFKFHEKRGSMTDMGCFYIVLGPPEERRAEPEAPGLVGSQLNQRETLSFFYKDWHTIGLTEALIVFDVDPRTHELHCDIAQCNQGSALARAVKKSIASPDLNEVPEWGRQSVAEAAMAKVIITGQGQMTRLWPPDPVPQPTWPHALILMKHAATLDPLAASDPLTGVVALTSFSKQNHLEYASEYCKSGDLKTRPSLSVDVLIVSAAPEGGTVWHRRYTDVTPEAIRSSANCYLLRGSIPLAEVVPGAYKLILTVADPSTEQKYNLEQEFKVE
jgi:GWxTD domain-containing protein